MKINVFWFRRDLRLHDNAGLYSALSEGHKVLPIFIFDSIILDKLQDRDDARVTFIYNTIEELRNQIRSQGSDLKVFFGDPIDIWNGLVKEYDIKAVFTNSDYDHYSIERDKKVHELLHTKGVKFKSLKDHVIFEKNEILKSDGTPYTVFTPYKNKWLEKLRSDNPDISQSFYLKAYPTEKYFHNFLKFVNLQPDIVTLERLGFIRSNVAIPPMTVKQHLIKMYDKTRDFPGHDGTSKLGIHFRFGTISIREKSRLASTLNTTYLNELIWRDFYNMILFQFPHVEKGAFRQEYNFIKWRNDENEFEMWKQGRTGFPIVDAGMRELLHTGYMHNRVRMIVASFLTKHLLIDWRWGEAWFAQKLLDFDLASNNGGWQWAAGSGTDAAPYFRIFNPEAQTKKFDPQYIYIKKWISEWATSDYPQPMIDHKLATERCLSVYKSALSKT